MQSSRPSSPSPSPEPAPRQRQNNGLVAKNITSSRRWRMRYDRSPRDIFQRELRFYVFRIEGFRLEINQLYFESGVPVALNGYNRPYNRRSLIGMEIFLFSLGKIGHDHMVTEVSCVPVCEESLTFLGVGRIYPKTPLHLFPWEFIA